MALSQLLFVAGFACRKYLRCNCPGFGSGHAHEGNGAHPGSGRYGGNSVLSDNVISARSQSSASLKFYTKETMCLAFCRFFCGDEGTMKVGIPTRLGVEEKSVDLG